MLLWRFRAFTLRIVVVEQLSRGGGGGGRGNSASPPNAPRLALAATVPGSISCLLNFFAVIPPLQLRSLVLTNTSSIQTPDLIQFPYHRPLVI